MTNLDVATVATHWMELAKVIFVPHTRSNTSSWSFSAIV
jgi:hypothetical protein